MFDAQRTAIKQGQQAFKQTLAFRRNADRAAQSGLKAQESMQRQALEMTQAMAHAYVDTTTAMLPTTDAPERHENLDDVFSRFKEIHTELYDTLERELDRGVETFDELSEEYVETVDSNTDEMLESHRTVEDRTVETVDGFSQQVREGFERIQELQDEFEDQFERGSEQAEELLELQVEQVEQIQTQLEAESDRLQEQIRQESPQIESQQSVPVVEGGGEVELDTDVDAPERLELIDGLGETFRERLESAGITSLEELAASDPKTVAEVADVSEERAEDWIDDAEA